MAAKTEQFSEIHRKNMEAAIRLAQLSLENSQRIMALQNELAQTLLTESIDNAQALAGAGDPQEVLRLRATYAQETAGKMMTAAQRIAEVGNETRAQFAHLLTEQLAAGSHDMVESFQSFFAALPGQNATVMDSMQQALLTANSAFEQIAKASASVFAPVDNANPGKKTDGR